MSASLKRLAGLTALWAGVELLERVAYRAGVVDGAGAVAATVQAVVEDLADDLVAADVSDVVAAHVCDSWTCCPVPA